MIKIVVIDFLKLTL